MKKVTALGGVFFKSADPAGTQAWYDQHLGIRKSPDGSVMFAWRSVGDPEAVGYTIWAPFKADTKYFGAPEQSFMINYRVADLAALMTELKAAGVEVAGELEEHSYGKFAWIVDPEGRKIELWEPVDAPFTEKYQDHTIY